MPRPIRAIAVQVDILFYPTGDATIAVTRDCRHRRDLDLELTFPEKLLLREQIASAWIMVGDREALETASSWSPTPSWVPWSSSSSSWGEEIARELGIPLRTSQRGPFLAVKGASPSWVSFATERFSICNFGGSAGDVLEKRLGFLTLFNFVWFGVFLIWG